MFIKTRSSRIAFPCPALPQGISSYFQQAKSTRKQGFTRYMAKNPCVSTPTQIHRPRFWMLLVCYCRSIRTLLVHARHRPGRLASAGWSAGRNSGWLRCSVLPFFLLLVIRDRSINYHSGGERQRKEERRKSCALLT